ncbi:hypothetical protein ACH41E_33470 [Streptomyces sp. NPDC020412]|uniref:hypothetical protein n=1 Tax=Streptomyces sp. NPDC020412 TaxID=3365073 RepID=UPI00378F0513
MEDMPKVGPRADDWYLAIPPPAVPVPAAHASGELHGRPAMVSVPGVGVLHDMRCVGGLHRDGVALVPEVDYWRAEFEVGRGLTPQRIDVDHVFIEHRLAYEAPPGSAPPPRPPLPGDPQALLRRISPRPDLPSGRIPVPARTVGHLHGRRIIQVTKLGFAWDLRAVSEPYEDPQHGLAVRLTSVPEYYRWTITGEDPNPVPIGLHLLWSE